MKKSIFFILQNYVLWILQFYFNITLQKNKSYKHRNYMNLFYLNDNQPKKEPTDYLKELGRGTWTLLHIIASKYPKEPSSQEKKNIKNFIFLLAEVFPCEDCRKHFSKLIHDSPPRVENHKKFVKWLCDIHNKVNKRLNKPLFDCSKHDDHWDCGCEK